jgi:hypothetical protein
MVQADVSDGARVESRGGLGDVVTMNDPREYPTLRTTLDGGSVRDEMFRPSSGGS